MSVTADESLASLRLLVSVAKADGVLHDKERESLEATLAHWEPEDGAPVDVNLALGSLLAEAPDLDAVLGAIRTDEARHQAYSAAFAMSNADGDCSAEEQAVLDRIRRTFGITDEQHRYLERVFEPHSHVVRGKEGMPTAFEGIERQSKVDAETRKSAIVCAMLGAFPFPLIAIATDLAAVALQVALAKDIAKFWGKEMDTEKVKGMLAGFGVGTGARIAVTNLLKVFPGWGSVAGAAAAYASTYAVGKVVNSYFEQGEVDAATLKAEFKKAEAEGKKQYKADKNEVDERADANRQKLEDLSAQLKAGEISQAEFEQRVFDM